MSEPFRCYGCRQMKTDPGGRNIIPPETKDGKWETREYCVSCWQKFVEQIVGIFEELAEKVDWDEHDG